MKEVILFCGYEIHWTRMPGCFRSCSWCLWKALNKMGAWAWFHDFWTCKAKVLEYWMISSLKIKLNSSWKFWRNWNVPFGVVGKDLDEQDLMEFIPRFWKEKSVKDVVILGSTAQATLVFMEWVLREKPRGEGKQKCPKLECVCVCVCVHFELFVLNPKPPWHCCA